MYIGKQSWSRCGPAHPCLSSSLSCKVDWEIIRTVWNLCKETRSPWWHRFQCFLTQHETPERIAIHGVHCLNSLIAKVRLVALFRISLLLPRIVPPSGYEDHPCAIVYPSANLPSQRNQTKSELILKNVPTFPPSLDTFFPCGITGRTRVWKGAPSRTSGVGKYTEVWPSDSLCNSTPLSPGTEPRPQAPELQCQMSKVNVFLGEEACHWVSLTNTGKSSKVSRFLSSL